MTKQATGGADNRATLVLLMLGNVVIGTGVLAPAAMINGLTADLGVGPAAVGALIGWGAVVLCIGAPVLAFLSARIDRRALLTACLAVYAAGHAASAFAADYEALLWTRLAMIAAAAVYTPQAASTVALIVSEHRRAGAVSLVFMGWAIAGAAASPMLAIVAEQVGWRTGFLGVAIAAACIAVGVFQRTPAGLKPPPMSPRAWGEVIIRPTILVLLLTTFLQVAGQFTLFAYLAAEVKRSTGAGPGGVAGVLAIYGASGLAGSFAATALVARIGAPRLQITSLVLMACGLAAWTFTSPVYALAAATALVWGLGFGPGVSMQQARLIAAGPTLASASVALNTSFLYLGQAVGSATGAHLIERHQHVWLGPVGALFMTAAIGLSATAWRRFRV